MMMQSEECSSSNNVEHEHMNVHIHVKFTKTLNPKLGDVAFYFFLPFKCPLASYRCTKR